MSLLLALLFIGGRTWADSRFNASIEFVYDGDKTYEFEIDDYVLGKCVNFETFLQGKATKVFLAGDNMTMTLYEEPMCGGEKFHLNTDEFGNLKGVELSDVYFKNKASSYKILQGIVYPDMTVHQDMDYEGKLHQINFIGDNNCHNTPGKLLISSVDIAENASLGYLLCEKKNCNGKKMEVTVNMPYLGIMNDNIKSVAKLHFPQAAILYEHNHYHGKQWNITFSENVECQNLPDHFMNITSSVLASQPVILYAGQNCKGKKLRVKTNIMRLKKFNDIIQSFKKELPAAVLYEDINYGGRKAYITFSDSDCETLPKYLIKATSSLIAFKQVNLRTGYRCTNGSYLAMGAIPQLPTSHESWQIDDNVVAVQKV